MDKAGILSKYENTKLVNVFLTSGDAPVQLVVDIDEKLYDIYTRFIGKIRTETDQTLVSYAGMPNIQISRKTGELLSLLPYWNGSAKLLKSKLSGYKFVVYRTTSSNFKQFRAIVVKDTKRGFYVEENPPVLPLINTDVLAVACFDALDTGSIMKRENMISIDGVFVPYSLVVKIGIVSSQLRLDHALALMKILGRDTDMYGDKIAGVVPYHFNMRVKDRKWKIVYGLDENGDVKPGYEASIDHVLAKANGGEDHLVNMHLMRKDRNSAKSDDTLNMLPDPIETTAVLNVMTKGVLKAKESGSLDKETAHSIMEIIEGEYSACKRAADYLQKLYSKQARAVSRRAGDIGNWLKG